ncbi:MAG TPA: ComF family protein [Herbaspirillum sp.]|jgi:ComF family protein
MFAPMKRLSALAAQLRFLIPSSCALCGLHAREILCEGCRRQFFTPAGRRCPVCAMPIPNDGDGAADNAPRCGDCLRVPPDFDATVVAADYAAPLDQLVLALKFGEKLALAPLFARMLADALLRRPLPRTRADASLPALLTCVPLSARRLQARGFNQSLEIARPLARLAGVALAPQLLLRIRDTRAQSQLTPPQRRNNIAGAFEVAPPYARSIAGLHIGVVDDVITTGQTLNEIAVVLKRRGAARVTNLVFARTLR